MMADVSVDVMLGAPVARSFMAVAAGSKLGLALIELSDRVRVRVNITGTKKLYYYCNSGLEVLRQS